MNPYEKLLHALGDGWPETLAEMEAEMMDQPHVIEFLHSSGEQHVYGPYSTGWEALMDADTRLARLLDLDGTRSWVVKLHSLYGISDPDPDPN